VNVHRHLWVGKGRKSQKTKLEKKTDMKIWGAKSLGRESKRPPFSEPVKKKGGERLEKGGVGAPARRGTWMVFGGYEKKTKTYFHRDQTRRTPFLNTCGGTT